jgi:hypothetical protein
MGKMDRKTAIFKKHTTISSWMRNGVVRKENHFQEHNIVFWRKSGIVRKKRLRLPSPFQIPVSYPSKRGT